MAVRIIVLENSQSRQDRHARLLEAVRRELKDDKLVIEYSDRGKPLISGRDKHISVTTTGSYMVAALSDSAVGIDGEYTARFTDKRGGDYLAIAERFFTEEEADYVRDGDGDPLRFAKIWIRKEACVKYTGRGMVDFPNFSVCDGQRFYGRVNGVPIKKLAVHIKDAADYMFAIAGAEPMQGAEA